jgi:hypothetical protein
VKRRSPLAYPKANPQSGGYESVRMSLVIVTVGARGRQRLEFDDVWHR